MKSANGELYLVFQYSNHCHAYRKMQGFSFIYQLGKQGVQIKAAATFRIALVPVSSGIIVVLTSSPARHLKVYF